MIRRDMKQLAVFHIEKETTTVPLGCLRSLYLEKTADVIYIVLSGKLYGIVAVKEALKLNHNGEVDINRNYLTIDGYSIARAQEIFQRNRRIHKIPIVNKQEELLGEYSCWDDGLYIEQNLDRIMQEKTVSTVLNVEGTLYLIEPVEEKRKAYMRFRRYLDILQIEYVMLCKEKILDTLQEQAVYIFVDEDEKRGTMCLYGIDPGFCDEYEESPVWYDVFLHTDRTLRITTYKKILRQIERESYWKQMGIHKPEKFSCKRIDDKASFLLSEIQKKGIRCFVLLYENEKKILTDYWEQFNTKLQDRLKNRPISLVAPWSKGEEDPDFYGELYEKEDYKNGAAQREIFNGVRRFQYEMNLNGKYFNAKDGKRITCFQPEQYIGTVYLMGMCMIVGRHVEDQFTISSCLQKILQEKGYYYRVENCGVITRRDAEIENWIEKINHFHSNDIVIYQSSIGEVIGAPCISTSKIFEKYHIPTEWVMDNCGHCNHKVNQLIADNLFGMIKQGLLRNQKEPDHYGVSQINIHNIMQDYVRYKYLNRYFSHFNSNRFHKIGAIVMNCDPFHKGHRYVIEQAMKQVECLIIFLIRESRTLFNFEERLQMVEEGVRDIENIIVVPNGDFVLSENNFREYYVRREDEVAAINAKYDLNVFAEYIAGPLHISHRFAGKETGNNTMKVYNDVMKELLPSKGITYVEVPKMMIDGEIIRSSRIRRHIRKQEYGKAFIMMTEPTKRYLSRQLS